MAHVISLASAREVSPLPIRYNAWEHYIDEHTIHAQYAANPRVGDSHGRQTPCREKEERAKASS
jgi:hypothetical protein